jgi:hypothetical protein
LYQLILFPEDVALRFEVTPPQIVAGLAVTLVGFTGNAATVTVAVTELVHPFTLV